MNLGKPVSQPYDSTIIKSADLLAALDEISANIDGGSATTVYGSSDIIDGGSAI